MYFQSPRIRTSKLVLVWPLKVYVGRYDSLVRVDLVRFAGSEVHLVVAVGYDLHQSAIGLSAQLSFLAESHAHDIIIGRIHPVARHAV